MNWSVDGVNSGYENLGFISAVIIYIPITFVNAQFNYLLYGVVRRHESYKFYYFHTTIKLPIDENL